MKNIPKIVQEEEKVLHEVAKAVLLSEIKKPKIKKIIEGMILALDGQKDGVGLAAPQIGIPLRIFIVSGNILSSGKPLICINPEIKKRSKETKWLQEGCLSVRWTYGEVKRHARVTLEAYDENGEKFMRGASGLLAHIFQHEVDHLDGILFIDKAKNTEELSDEEKDAYTKKYDLTSS